MMTDIKIAQMAALKPMDQIAQQLGIEKQYLEPYGIYKAKLSDKLDQAVANRPDGKLILVTAINPTPAGEGKTTITVGLGQAMHQIGKKAVVALREPSLGPVFGIKGGAAGGGYAQVVPMEDLNLHFTGDMHAVTAANNLLCAILDNHLQQGNQLSIDPRRVLFKRCMDMNDRALRSITVGLGGKVNGIPREDGFQITVASEVMAILCLANDIQDLKQRLGKMLVAYTYDNRPVFAKDLQVHGAMTVLLKDAVKPNLVQTLENTPAIVHGGPFANIAHGCNSVKGTKLALKLADYVITEAGFGSDLGAEKFLDIKCRYAGIQPSCIVVVATIRALKYNGGVERADLSQENLPALMQGMSNLTVHVENMRKFGVPVVVALNRFHTDTQQELDAVADHCKQLDCEVASAEVFAKGGKGGVQLAQKLVDACDQPSHFEPLYRTDQTIKKKLKTVAQEIYRADDVTYSKEAEKAIAEIEALGMSHLPVCVAKTQYSLSDDPTRRGVPTGFQIRVQNLKVSAGAGFIVVYTGNVMTMPGLPKTPAAHRVDIDQHGEVQGLF